VEYFAQLSDLQILRLEDNNADGGLPEDMSALTNIREVHVTQSMFVV
jgi:hypothetical protein